MDSAKIAIKLEEIKPHPSLHLDPVLEEEAQRVQGEAFMALVPTVLPRYREVAAPIDHEWFEADRTRRFGMSPAEMGRQRGGQVALDAAAPLLDALEALLEKYKKDEGPFLLGSQVCYADFIIVATMQMFRRIGEDAFEMFVGGREGLRKLHQACEPWLQRLD